MSARSTFKAFIIAVAATIASGLVYAAAKWRFDALAAAGEGTEEEVRSTVRAVDYSFLALVITAMATVILFAWFVMLGQRDAERASK